MMEFKLMPVEPTHEIIKAMAESRAKDDEGTFSPMCDLLDFSGENKTHVALAAAYVAAIAAAPTVYTPYPHQPGSPHFDGADAFEAYQNAQTAPAPSEWISVKDRLPEVDEDDMAYVWAVNVGCPGFDRVADACNTRYHQSLGWQPQGSTGWDWVITHWMHFPELPTVTP